MVVWSDTVADRARDVLSKSNLAAFSFSTSCQLKALFREANEKKNGRRLKELFYFLPKKKEFNFEYAQTSYV